MNTRLQVEHPVTELVTGLDLVELQLSVAEGAAAARPALHRRPSHGHAIEVRLCAEDPDNGYLPSSGTFRRRVPRHRRCARRQRRRVSGSMVSPYYDSMIAKVIAHAPTRAEARQQAASCPEHGAI